MIFEQFEKLEFSYWNSSKICWMKWQLCRILWMELWALFSIWYFQKLNETAPRYFMLVLILKWNYLSIVQRSFVLLPHVHCCFGWVLVWNILMMFLNDPWWKVMYFKIELGFYLIVHILSFFPAGIGLLLCNLDFDIFFRRIWTVFMNRLIELTPLKILLLVALLERWN